MEQHPENANIIAVQGGDFAADNKANKIELKNERIRSRIWELDFLRGICVILMIFDHLMYDLGPDMFSGIWFAETGNVIYENIGKFADAYWFGALRGFVRPLVVLCFFTLCGISCSFSRNNFKRGIILFCFAMLITLVTTLIGMPIKFGVLHMLAVSIIIVALVRLITRGKKWAGIITSLVVAAVIFTAYGIINSVDVTPNNNLAFLAEAFADNFDSADYFPLLPHSGFVLIGAAIAPLLYPKKRTICSTLDTQFRWYRPFNFFGRHAAFFYLTHQVIWALVLGIYTIIAIPNGWNVIVTNFFS